MIGRWWPGLVAGVNILVLVLSIDAYLGNADNAALFLAVFGASVVTFSLTGALLVTRVRTNPIGYLLLGSGTILGLSIGSEAYVILSVTRAGGGLPATTIAALVSTVAFNIPIVLVFVGVPLLLPDGRLLSPRWRLLVALAVAALSALTIASLLRPGPIGDWGIVNPFGVAGIDRLLDALDAFANNTSIFGFGGAALAVVLRYQRGNAVQRAQLRWPTAVASVGAVAFPVAFMEPASGLSDAAFFVALASLAALPVAIGVAVLRYRLYDIDRIISRTLAYGLVTAVLVVVFAGLVLGLQAVLAPLTQESTIAVAASTLVVFALFQPLRRGVQRVVDRRFHRARIDAERTTAAFAGRLRDQLDLDTLGRELTVTVEAALQPSAVGVWLRRTNP